MSPVSSPLHPNETLASHKHRLFIAFSLHLTSQKCFLPYCVSQIHICVCVSPQVWVRERERAREKGAVLLPGLSPPARIPDGKRLALPPYVCVFSDTWIDEKHRRLNSGLHDEHLCTFPRRWMTHTQTHKHMHAASTAVMRHLYLLVIVLADLRSLLFGLRWFMFLSALQVNTCLEVR